jgi:UDP-N-acetylmuramoyl-L-alanyl-D-glutamate--2,6-diaminopimelate ligase
MNDIKHSLESLRGKYLNFKHLITSIIEVIKLKYPAKDLFVIGITGTDGKTTTSHLTYEIFKKAGYSTALLSTVAAYISNKEIDTGFHVTTPDAKFLQPFIKKVVDKKIKYLILETTSHGLDQHRVLGCNFKIGVLTNITHEHLDYHESFAKYKKAKAKLFKGVEKAILNRDDETFGYFKKQIRKDAKLVSYSLKKNATLKAKKIKLTTNGMSFVINQRRKNYKLSTKLVGKYNVSNILASIAVARQVGISWEKIRKAVSEFKGVKGRMELIDEGQNFSVIVDFAHTPNALENVLKTLKRLKSKKNKIIAVFGCAGERDYLKRPVMAGISSRLSDISIFTAEDPRSEDVNNIIKQMLEGVNKNLKKKVHIIPERGEAIYFAINKLAKKGDIVAILGKGHEDKKDRAIIYYLI